MVDSGEMLAVAPALVGPQLKRDPLATRIQSMDSTGFGGEYFVGWGTLALINAALAQTKNRSRLAWFLLSLFLGPLATLAILLVDKAS